MIEYRVEFEVEVGGSKLGRRALLVALSRSLSLSLVSLVLSNL